MDVNKVRVLLMDVENKRNSKIVNGLKDIEISTIYLSLPNVSSFELNKLRHYVLQRLRLGSQITDIQKTQNQSGDYSENQDEIEVNVQVEESDYENDENKD